MGVCEYLGKVCDRSAQLQHFLKFLRQGEQSVGDFIVVLGTDRSLPFGDAQGHHGHDRHLARECLGGGNADLRTDVHVRAAVRRAGDAGSDHVADAVDKGTSLARKGYGSQRICGLTRLRHCNHDVIREKHGIAVAEFRSVLHLRRNAAYVLEQLLADERRVPGGAAGDEYHAPRCKPAVDIVPYAREDDAAALGIDAAADAVDDGTGLLIDLLEHEGWISALLQVGDGNIQRGHFDVGFTVLKRHQLKRFAPFNHCNLTVLDINYVMGVFDYR